MLDGDTYVFALVPKGQIVDWAPGTWWPGDEDTCWLTEDEAESLINALEKNWHKRLSRNFYSQLRLNPDETAALSSCVQRAAEREPAKLASTAKCISALAGRIKDSTTHELMIEGP